MRSPQSAGPAGETLPPRPGSTPLTFARAQRIDPLHGYDERRRLFAAPQGCDTAPQRDFASRPGSGIIGAKGGSAPGNGTLEMIIDCHGHYTTAPKALEDWRNAQIAGIKDKALKPSPSSLKISDDELRQSIEANQLKFMRERGSDLTIFSPRASFMAHHIGDFEVSSVWASICNELIFRVAKLFPDSFIGAAMLPQSPGVDPKTCIPELERCVRDYGFVGINLNPDPSGGHWTSPPLTDKHWYPIYEKMVEYDIPAMVHVSTSCNACFHTTGAHYINADTTAVMQLIQGDLFKDFPTLRFVIPHGGGAAPYHWGRYRGLAQELKKPLLKDHLLKNVYFDTCVYHQPGVDLLTKVIPVENVLFASEMIGAVRGIDPETGHNYDDTKRYIEATLNLNDAERRQIYEGNARRVYPRLDAALKARGR
jgi:4-oxalmesaconate hydratase